MSGLDRRQDLHPFQVSKALSDLLAVLSEALRKEQTGNECKACSDATLHRLSEAKLGWRRSKCNLEPLATASVLRIKAALTPDRMQEAGDKATMLVM